MYMYSWSFSRISATDPHLPSKLLKSPHSLGFLNPESPNPNTDLEPNLNPNTDPN